MFYFGVPHNPVLPVRFGVRVRCADGKFCNPLCYQIICICVREELLPSSPVTLVLLISAELTSMPPGQSPFNPLVS